MIRTTEKINKYLNINQIYYDIYLSYIYIYIFFLKIFITDSTMKSLAGKKQFTFYILYYKNICTFVIIFSYLLYLF